LKKEKVRSKSEVIIADRLFINAIPYEYERGLIVKIPKTAECPETEMVWNPDFRVLNVRTGKEYIWEHFGRMSCY